MELKIQEIIKSFNQKKLLYSSRKSKNPGYAGVGDSRNSYKLMGNYNQGKKSTKETRLKSLDVPPPQLPSDSVAKKQIEQKEVKEKKEKVLKDEQKQITKIKLQKVVKSGSSKDVRKGADPRVDKRAPAEVNQRNLLIKQLENKHPLRVSHEMSLKKFLLAESLHIDHFDAFVRSYLYQATKAASAYMNTAKRKCQLFIPYLINRVCLFSNNLH